jgi:DNA-binding IclR family transcriptional regulator
MPRIDGPQHGEGLQAVAMALLILEHLARHRGDVGVTELARALETTKSRIHRHLRTLLEAGYIVQAQERYRIGHRLVTLGRAVSENFDLATVAREEMRALRDRVGQTVVLSRAEPAGAVVLATLPGEDTIEISAKSGAMMALHCTAQGKLTLAHAEAALRDRVLLSRLDLRTPHTITDPARLRQELDLIRGQGWATAAEESLVGVNALAAPIFEGGGGMVGAIALLGSIQFIPRQPAAELVRQVRDAAGRISARLGWVLDSRRD